MTTFISEFINSYRNNLSEFKEGKKNTETFPWVSKIVIICAIGLFYFLGYLFLYGYYFGGKISEKSSLIQIITVPVPFNFESVIGVGILFTAIFLCFLPLLMAFVKILHEKDNNTKENIKALIGCCFILFLFNLLICTFVAYFFSGTFEFTKFPIYLFIQLLSIFLLAALLYSGNIQALIFGVSNFFALFLVFIVFNFIFNIDASFIKNGPNNYFSLCIVLSAIISIYLNMKIGLFFIFFDFIFLVLLCNAKYLDLILKEIYLFSSSIINISWIYEYLKQYYTSVVLIIILFMTYGIAVGFLKLIEKFAPDWGKDKQLKDFFAKFVSTQYMHFSMVQLSVAIIVIVISISNIFYLIIDCGTYLSKKMPPSLDTIKYYVAQNDDIDKLTKAHSFKGYVVSCKDNIYYISTEDRELVTLHRYSIITMPKSFTDQ